MTGIPTARTLKSSLLVSIAVIVLPGHAGAQDTTFSDAQTAPVVTSVSGDTEITSDGSITVASGTAVTIDSDNSVENGGTIAGGEGDDVIGVQVTSDSTFSFTQSGSIDLTSELESTIDEVTDGTVEDETAPDFGDDRFGFLIAAGSYTGDVAFTDTSSINLDGDNSSAFAIMGDLVGNVVFNGDIVLQGEGSSGIGIDGDVTGDVVLGTASSIRTFGVNTNAVDIGGNIDGAVIFGGAVSTTGFTDPSPDSEVDDPDSTSDDAAVAAAIAENNVQKGLTSGHAIVVSGSVSGGVVLEGDAGAEFDRVADVIDTETLETTTTRVSVATSQVTTLGSGNALRIDGGLAGLTLGLADTSNVIDARETIDDDGNLTGICLNTDDEEVTCLEYGQYGLINRGDLLVGGIYEGVDSTAVYIANATIEGGFRNDGFVDSRAENSLARGIVFSTGADTPLFLNEGRISATASGDDAETIGLSIEAGASILELVNTNRIEVQTTSDTGNATAILDASGSVASFTNFGFITAAQINDTTEPPEDADPQTVAMDFSANTTGVAIRNTTPDTFDPDSSIVRAAFGNVIGDVYTGSGDDLYYTDAGQTFGDIFLGAGNDSVDVLMGSAIVGDIDFGSGDAFLDVDDGTIAGDLTFGTGNHTLALSSGSIVRGTLTTMGTTDISIIGSRLLLENTGVINLGSLSVLGDDDGDSVLGISVAEDGSSIGRINANSISIADGTEIRAIFTRAFASFGEDGGDTLEGIIMSAGTTDINVDALDLNVTGNSPVLFEQAIRQDGNDIIFSLRRKTASELGLGRGLEAAFDPVIAALTQDEDLGAALFNTTTVEEFQSAFNQVVAGPLDAPLAYARMQNSSMTSLISQRVELLGGENSDARTAWIQQQSYFVDREASEDSNGFDGGGFVIAMGADTPVGELDVLGIAAHLSSARYDEQLGDDFPFNRLAYGLDVYAAEDMGAVELDGRVGYAVSDSESERNVVFGGQRRQILGKWEGTQLSANGRVRYRYAMGEKYEVTPFASVDYIKLEEDAYTETGDDILALQVSDREATSLRGNLGVSIGRVYKLRPSAYDTSIPGTLTPRLTAGYSHEFSNDDIEATYNFDGGEAFTLVSEPETGAAVVGADLDYQNQYAKVSVGASGAFGDQINAYTLRVGVGLKW